MGDVYLATDRQGRMAALKVVRSDLARDPAFRARFAREVAVCRRITGPGVAGFLGADVNGPEPWLATEYVRGPTLADHVAAVGPMRGAPLVALAGALAESLARIHAAGITHRDLKPGNVILTADRPVVIDFGIAAACDVATVTSAGMIVGSPGWLAPEQVLGSPVGTAADVFAWGGVVAFAATGRPPFGEGPPDVLLYRVVHADADLVGLDDPIVRPPVVAALAKDPSRRPTVDRLRAAVASRAAHQTTAGFDRTWVRPSPPPPAPMVTRRRRRWWPLALTAAVVVAGVGGAYGLTRFASPAPDEAVSATTAAPPPATVAPTTVAPAPITTTPTTAAPVSTTVPPAPSSSVPAATNSPASPATTVVRPAAPGRPAAPMPQRIDGYVAYGGLQTEEITVPAGGEPVSPELFESRNGNCAGIVWTARWHTADAGGVLALRKPNDASWFDVLDRLFGSPPRGTPAADGYLSGSICDRPAFVRSDTARNAASRATVVVEWQYWRATS